MRRSEHGSQLASLRIVLRHSGGCLLRPAGRGRSIAPGEVRLSAGATVSPVRGSVQRMLDPGSFPCSSRLRSKLSPPFSGPRKSPTAAGIRATGLGVRKRNVSVNRSPKADLSPELESRPFYSTSFSAHAFSGLASLWNRKVRIPFACRLPRSQQQTGYMTPKPQSLIRLSLRTQAINETRPTPWATIFPRKVWPCCLWRPTPTRT
jgi:hypothetical protein